MSAISKMTKVTQDSGSRITQNSYSTSHDRKLRYRELLGDLSALDIEGANNDERVERTGTAVQEAKSLLAEGGVEERVRHPGEGYLDSRVLRATSDLAIRSSEAVSGNANTYDKHELAKHIKENPRFWELSLPRELPPWPALFGAFDAAPLQPRERVPRRRLERQRVAPLQAPEDVQKMDKTEEGSEMVSRVYRFIQKGFRNSGEKPLSYFHVALDPNSFARSVENIYYISFLVRDGMIGIELDKEHELPFMRPIPEAQREANQEEKHDNQFIVSLDMAGWQELVEAFRITEPMMVLKRS